MRVYKLNCGNETDGPYYSFCFILGGATNNHTNSFFLILQKQTISISIQRIWLYETRHRPAIYGLSCTVVNAIRHVG